MWWIGGSPCSGKSTIAATLSGRPRPGESTAAATLGGGGGGAGDGGPVYSCDDAFERHGGPTFDLVRAMSIGQRLAQPIEVQVEQQFRLYREQWPQILADLTAPSIVEGAALIPELLDSHGVPRDRAVFVVPTAEFQRRQYRRRSWVWTLLATTGDPEDAFDRWMRRDETFALLVADQARDAGYRVLTVDGTESAADLATAVSVLLAPERAPGPH
ncbi:hypothetical protein [Dactylosporangium sp. CS-033363]|uniref:hypothetical protein n=1 Tax=Dactylosporangium sp. CS-033363 TaxID=3239935 RepID=UPI003D8A5E75